MRYSRTVCGLGLMAILMSGCRSGHCERDTDCSDHAICVAQRCLPRHSDVHPSTVQELDTQIRSESHCEPPKAGRLVLNEILADPQGSDSNRDGVPDPYADEFIEAYNLEDYAVQLEGVAVLVGSQVRHVFSSYCLAPKTPVTLFGAGPAPEKWEDGYALASEKRLSLSNRGAQVRLISSDGTVLDTHRYSDKTKGPRSVSRNPDGTGSWEPHPPNGNNSPAVV